MNKQEFEKLAKRIFDGTATQAEVEQYNAWFGTFTGENSWDTAELGELAAIKNQLFVDIDAEIKRKEKVRVLPLYPKMAVAVSILLVLSLGYYVFFEETVSQSAKDTLAYHNDIAPGHSRATLTLANGKKIILTKGLNGHLAMQGGTAVTANGESISYLHQQTAGKEVYNTITTARGEQLPFPVTLSDGTEVWLNAQSILSFPVAFNGKERIVKLSGEGYFKVKHIAAKPFKVQTARQTIQDIGTSFNVNAYTDEQNTVTTVAEGSVMINRITLKAGEQTDGTKVSKVDLARYLAWKNDDFDFQGDRIETVMRSLSRWYNLEVVWQGPVTNEIFYATLSRQRPISGILRALEKTKGVHFTIEGRRVVVSK